MEMLTKVTCIVMLCMVVVAPHAEALTCGQVSGNLAPCISYLRSGGAVTSSCCGGIKALNSAAKTTPDRQTACNCLKSLANQVKVNYANAGGLPGKCGVSIPYKISPSTDCSKVK